MLSKKRFLLAVTLVMVIVLVSVTAVLAHGGNLSLIHACVNKNSGAIRIVGANSTCSLKETALDWGIVGPAGPQGDQGLQGPPGPASLPSFYRQTLPQNYLSISTHYPDVTRVGTFELPRGRWALFVTIHTVLSASGMGTGVKCEIPEVLDMTVRYAPGVPNFDYGGVVNSLIDLQMQNVTGGYSSLPWTISLECTLTDNYSGADFHTAGASLLAIEVAP
jgi:hypothetical protein